MRILISVIILSAIALLGISTFSGVLYQRGIIYIGDIPKTSPEASSAKLTFVKKTLDTILSGTQNVENQQIILKGEDTDQINFLFLGIGGEEHVSGKYLTDTIIVGVFIPSNKKTAFISIPRDLLVLSPNGGGYTRINALYAMPPKGEPEDKGSPGSRGVEHTKKTIAAITGIQADYYAIIDLEGVEEIVSILGGINIAQNYNLKDSRFPDKNYGYEIYEIKEGWRYMNGEDAVKYIRTRHTQGGDFDRMKRQQEVAMAIKNKIDGLKSLSGLPKVLSLYEAIQDHFTTNLKFNEIMRLMDLAEGANDSSIILERITAEQGDVLKYDSIIWNGIRASVLSPKAGREEYSEIKDKIETIVTNLKSADTE
ncbi:MAG: hypothetical protein A3B96_03200 [Candidatus Spechtbacteria bacterium RIFCSPHIGHO2_02_FULL_43_15b]|uniref:Cell envelope-related transcriptional attenuator domain-containing protein n=1 Tax=Candidatus Spechtbacteria bacterium RIFCSPHIGHO2_01_FULL_43_30 TaxID=1802158 RepID=A0A1G2H903_9BACT|nr:MAG: hypothetical protein A2827_00450 [Candidatus Spechtbacteria bacterium RIFCSPHIGHO2_01_FULL_43_30]OGZ59750.1 MAG: hypothetical protein A3B96_03200 [Candidatus Spechtbacteria bacterium RIFCSPHIGHO2_02_FULL_43_15b]